MSSTPVLQIAEVSKQYEDQIAAQGLLRLALERQVQELQKEASVDREARWAAEEAHSAVLEKVSLKRRRL